MRDRVRPCPSFPWFFGFPWLILSKEFPWLFHGFLCLFQGFRGFGRDRKSLVILRFSLIKTKKPRKGRTGKGGLTNGGLSPKFSEKIGGKSFLENRAFSGQIGAISGLVGAFSGPIGTNSSAPHSHGGRAEIAPKGPFLARLAPFGLSPPLLSPRLDFPDWVLQITNRKSLVIWNRGAQIARISPKSLPRTAQFALSNRAICALNLCSHRR